MPLLPGKKNIGRNIKIEEKSGKSKDEALAIALSVSKKPKYAKGGQIPSAKLEKRPMPDQMGNDAKQANKASDKPAHDDNWLDQSTVAQARKPSRVALKHPSMVPSNAFSVKLRNQEDDLEMSAKPGPYDAQPKKMAKGGMINEEISMHEAEMDNEQHPEGLESDNDQMKPSEDEIMADHFAEGGIAHEMDDQPEDEEHLEHDASIAGAIMRRRKMADGGEVDLSQNADEEPNNEDQMSFDALKKENYNESEGLDELDQPEDSNEHGHNLSDEDAHDLVGKIRRLMKSRNPITK